MLIRPYDMSNKDVYYTMLCSEVDRIAESRVADATKTYLYWMFFCEE